MSVTPPAAPPAGPAPTLAERLLTGATSVVAQLTGKGWPEPYALILGTDLYTRASSPLVQGSTETPASRLAPRAKHILVSDALTTKNGVVVSLAGDPTTLCLPAKPRRRSWARPSTRTACITTSGPLSESNMR